MAGGQVSSGLANNTVQMPSQQNKRGNYEVKVVRRLAITIIYLGCMCIVAQLIDILLRSYVSVAGCGIWSGTFTIIAGSLGIQSTSKRSTGVIVSFLVMSVIAAFLSIAPITAGSLGIVFAINNVSIAFNAIMIVCALLSGILLIIGSAFACLGLCGGLDSNAVLVAGQVQYIPGADGQQQMVILPINQPSSGGAQLTAGQGPTMATVMPGQQVVINNPTGAGQHVYIHPGSSSDSALPPNYEGQITPPPEYQEKQPLG